MVVVVVVVVVVAVIVVRSDSGYSNGNCNRWKLDDFHHGGDWIHVAAMTWIHHRLVVMKSRLTRTSLNSHIGPTI